MPTPLPTEAAHVILVGAGNWKDFSSRFECCCKPPRGLRYTQVADMTGLPEHIVKNGQPHLVVISPDSWRQGGQPLERLLVAGLKALRKSDRACCSILLWEKEPTSHELMHWLDAGATSLLRRDFEPLHVQEGLAEVLTRRLEAHLPRHPRVNARHEVNMRVASLTQGVAAETLNVGCGGMFVRHVPREAKTGDRVVFELTLGQDLSQPEGGREETPTAIRRLDTAELARPERTIKGEGIIVWVRPVSDGKQAEGIGIQFTELSADARVELDLYLQERHIRSFIPSS